MAQAMAILDELSMRVGEPEAGWKIAARPGADPCWGALFQSRVFQSGARVPAGHSRLGLVEGEISFRLKRDLPARARAYSYDEVADALLALPSIEVLSCHYSGVTAANFRAVPQPEAFADGMMSGAFITGEACPHWRSLDFARLRFSLSQGKAVLFDQVGGYTGFDPVLPVLLLANHRRKGFGLRAGAMVATGSFTGAVPFNHGEEVMVSIEGIGRAVAIVG